MASTVEIMNRALQLVGAKRITALTEDSKNARAVAAARLPVLRAMLEDHDWLCATKRADLAADATPPDWGRGTSYTLPADFIRLSNPYPEDNWYPTDYEIEGRKIFSNDSGPIYIRYIYEIDDPNEMTPLFREAYAINMAMAMCEELTQSNAKKESLKDDLKEALRRARKSNAFQKIPVMTHRDTWLTVRR